VTHLTEFDGKPLQSVAKGALDLEAFADEQEKEQQQKLAEEAKELVARIQTALGERVQEVRVTHRLTDSPACLVAGEHELGAHLERMLKASGQPVPGSKPVLEINPQHALIARLKAETDEERFGAWAQVLFDQALLAEGGQLEDPAGFVARMNGLWLKLLG
jgi:molecular chaperone HtpG